MYMYMQPQGETSRGFAMLYETLRPEYTRKRTRHKGALDMRVQKNLTGGRAARAESTRQTNPKEGSLDKRAERAQELALSCLNRPPCKSHAWLPAKLLTLELLGIQWLKHDSTLDADSSVEAPSSPVGVSVLLPVTVHVPDRARNWCTYFTFPLI